MGVVIPVVSDCYVIACSVMALQAVAYLLFAFDLAPGILERYSTVEYKFLRLRVEVDVEITYSLEL